MLFKNTSDVQKKVLIDGENTWVSVYPGDTVDIPLQYGLRLGFILASEEPVSIEAPEPVDDELSSLRAKAEALWGPLSARLRKSGLKKLIMKGEALLKEATNQALEEIDINQDGKFDEDDFEALKMKKLEALKKKA